MIILVASVVLAIGVVIYGTSLFQTGAQQEVITIRGVSMWVNATNSTGVGWGAAAIRNSGDKLVSLDIIQVRGTTVPFINFYVEKNQSAVTVENYQSQFIHTTNDRGGKMKDSTAYTGLSQCPAGGNTVRIDLDGIGTKPSLCLKRITGPVSLNPGERLIVYFRLPDGIVSSIDSGTAANVSIFAGKTGAPITTIISNP